MWAAFPDCSIELISIGEIGRGLVAYEWLMHGTKTGPGVDGTPPTDGALTLNGGDVHPDRGREDSLAQLDVIREISDALSDAGVDHWLFGGWAVDFALGEVTRQHRDVDIVVWEMDVSRITGLLRFRGYRAQSSKHHRHLLIWEKSGMEVQINLITKATDGSIISPGTFSDWPWFEGSFGNHRGRIGELNVPIVSLAGQLESKENFSKHPAGQPLRAKDAHDIELLRALMRSEQRE